jgi:hypothetical protein
MSTRTVLALLVAVALATPSRAAVDIHVSGQSVDVQASNAPLSEVLDRVSRQTQMRVVYDGAPPRQMISLDLRGRTPVEIVVAAMEGQGVNYTFSMDATGTRVETLLVSGSASAPPAGAVRSAGGEGGRGAVREMPPQEPVVEEEAVPEDEGQAPPDTTAGLNAATGAASGGKDAAAAQQEAVAPPDVGLGGFSASPFAPTSARQSPPAQPQPQATPPPFNP